MSESNTRSSWHAPVEPRAFIPSARIPLLVRVAWRGDDGRWRYGSTDRSEKPHDGPEVVGVFEYDTGESVRFEGDDIDQLHVKPLPTGNGGRSTKRIG